MFEGHFDDIDEPQRGGVERAFLGGTILVPLADGTDFAARTALAVRGSGLTHAGLAASVAVGGIARGGTVACAVYALLVIDAGFAGLTIGSTGGG